PGRPVGPWLYAISEHRLKDFFRRQRRSERFNFQRHDLWEMTSSYSYAESLIELVLSALKQLPSKQKLVVELLKLSGFSVREVAARTGMSESAVKVNASRGYETIRKKIGRKKQ